MALKTYFTGQVIDVADGLALIRSSIRSVGACPLELVSLEEVAKDGMWRFFNTLDQRDTYVEYCEAPGGNKPIRLVPKDRSPLQ